MKADDLPGITIDKALRKRCPTVAVACDGFVGANPPFTPLMYGAYADEQPKTPEVRPCPTATTPFN